MTDGGAAPVPAQVPREGQIASGGKVALSRRSAGQPVRCRTATLRDYEQIHALEARHGLWYKSYAEWAHLWENNPVVRRHPELPVGWVLEDGRRQIVGSMGSIPFGFELGGRPLLASTGHAWVVDERYRAYAPLLFERFVSQPGVDLRLAVSPNHLAEPFVAREFERVPTGAWDRAAYWITNPRAFAESALARRRVRFRAVLRHPAWAAVALHRTLRRDALEAALKAAPRRDRTHHVETCTAVDDRFDEFWAATRARHPGRLLCTRSREVMAWHFRYPFAHDTAWISAVCDAGRLLAYAVFCRKDDATIGLRRVRLIDFQALDDDGAFLPAILAHAVERCRREGTAVLESVGWRLDPGNDVARLAPYTRALPSWQYYYRAQGPELTRALLDPAVWSPSQYEGNACL